MSLVLQESSTSTIRFGAYMAITCKTVFLGISYVKI